MMVGRLPKLIARVGLKSYDEKRKCGGMSDFRGKEALLQPYVAVTPKFVYANAKR